MAREMLLDDLGEFLDAAQIKPCRKTSNLSRCLLSFVIVTWALPFTKVKVCAKTPFLNVSGE